MKANVFLTLLLLCTLSPKAGDMKKPCFIMGACDTASLVFVGDIMMHAKQLEYDYRSFLEPINDYLKTADLTIANLEFTLAGPPYSGYPCFSAPDGFVRSLVLDSGIDIFLTANNHILDKGSKGFIRTLAQYNALCDSLGISYTGSGLSDSDFVALNPLIIKRNNITFALLNFTYGTNFDSSTNIKKISYPAVFRRDSVALKAAIQRAKDAQADIIIALPHWGTEYVLTHNDTQSEWARWLADQGVHLIVGSHPHVVQDCETITSNDHEVPVFYSLGNLVSNMKTTDTRKGLIVKITYLRDRFTGAITQLSPELRYTWCKLPTPESNNFSVSFMP